MSVKNCKNEEIKQNKRGSNFDSAISLSAELFPAIVYKLSVPESFGI